MKILLVIAALCFSQMICQAQRNLLAYEDILYIITNNAQKADDFMQSKGYTKHKVKKAGNLKYHLSLPGNAASDVEIRNDGKRIYIYLAKDELNQVNLLVNSISPFVLSQEDNSGITSIKVKDLGMIYMTINDKVPYSPIRKDYDIRIVSDKNITTYN
ncbi:hypothetical protein [Mucilaginibacter sp. PAMB04168]|uniref:hypothetical protein n=1 Tax=Mucilaginibacter sp. PAMB04168 TaxID=3138567 RepID=UPI0031F6C3C9